MVELTDSRLFAFVLMPFENKFDDVYRLGIKEAAEKTGFIAERVDEQKFYQEVILQRIYNQIDVCDLVIGDMTGRNPNVFYEVGYAHAKKKTCILMTSSASDIPFDLKHHRHIVYGDSIVNLKSKLIDELDAVKREILKKGKPLTTTLHSISGDLKKTKYTATAEVEMNIDINNYTEFAAPEIEAIYFYTGEGWTFKQDGQDCPQTKSDLESDGIRHLLKPPVRRLPKSGWAQIKIIGQKRVATAFKGETLLEEYKLSGYALVRISTSDGIFDEKLDLQVTATEFPF